MIVLGFLLPIVWTGYAFRQLVLDNELIDAIKTDDTKDALRCLNMGANPNTRDPQEQEGDRLDNMLDRLKRLVGQQKPPFHNPALIALFVDQSDPYGSKKHQENLEIARALLDHGANINACDETGASALTWALHLKWNKTAQLLLERGADIQLHTVSGYTPLMAARGELTEELIQRGSDVNAVNDFGRTPLHYACEESDLPAIRALIAHGADINAIAQDNSTPLLYAAWSRHPNSLEAMKLLLAHGADVRAKNAYGITVLMRAAQSGNVEKVKLALSKGTDVNARMKSGRTVIMMDGFEKHPEVLEVLLQHGADVNAKDAHGNTALSQAMRYHHDEEVRLLKAAGAKESPTAAPPPPSGSMSMPSNVPSPSN
jgi:ankyrin repeat protein